MLAAICCRSVGFYLVAGSVRRDRERGVGRSSPPRRSRRRPTCAASGRARRLPAGPRGARPAGGPPGFLRYGSGPFSLADFLLPCVLTGVPGRRVRRRLAVLFDVTPGLRGRGGLVLWFFFFSFVLMMIPHGPRASTSKRRAGNDHADADLRSVGLAIHQWRVAVPSGDSKASRSATSSRQAVRARALARARWRGTSSESAPCNRLSPSSRSASRSLFDRFDPARARRRRKKERKARESDAAEATSQREPRRSSSPPCIRRPRRSERSSPKRGSSSRARRGSSGRSRSRRSSRACFAETCRRGSSSCCSCR